MHVEQPIVHASTFWREAIVSIECFDACRVHSLLVRLTGLLDKHKFWTRFESPFNFAMIVRQPRMHRRSALITPTQIRSRLPLFGCVLACAGLLAFASRADAAPPCAELEPEACPLQLHSDTARGIALGTGLRASAVSTSALAYNPAALVLGKLYHLEGSVDYMSSYSGVALGAGIVDSSTSKVGAGIAFRGFVSGDEGISGIDGRAAIAFPFADAVSIGIGGRYLNLDYEALLMNGMTEETELVEGFTMDASIRVQPVPVVSLSLLAANFINLDSAAVPVLLGGGAAFAIADIASIGADLLFDVSTFDSAAVIFGAGVEVLVAQVAPIRLGYSFDTKRELHTLSGGAGYTDRSVGFDLSIQQQLSLEKDTRVMGAFRYYVR